MATSRHLPFAPAAGFVIVWSSGYIAGPYGVEAMSPLMLVAVRFVVAALLAFALARVLRGPLRVTRADGVRIALSGFVLNGVQFAAMYLAFDAGLGATLASLMHSLSPVLTALLAAMFFGERLSPLQVLGFLDRGHRGRARARTRRRGGRRRPRHRLRGHQRPRAQPRHAGPALDRTRSRPSVVRDDPVRSAAPPLLLLALVVEGTGVVRDPKAAAIAIVYLAVVNSIIGMGLLGILVRAGAPGLPPASSS